MENSLFVIVPDQRRVLAERKDLGQIESFLREHAYKSDAQEACESLGAVIAIDFTLAAEMEHRAYVKGYQRAITDLRNPKNAHMKIHRFAPVEANHG
jgi:hypothetical protein